MPAPIAIFVFNRPLHTRQTLRYLSECTGIENTIVYIFADGKRNDETADGLKQIEEVSNIIGSVKIGKQTIICERGSNLGLAKNIIAGVGEVIEQHEQIIVLEDDMEVTKGFLSYMNTALELYKNESQVGCIHAWNYLMETSANSDTTFFLKGADCWGWATWKRAWKFFNADGQALYNQIQSSRKEWDFDRRGTHAYTSMLSDQIAGKNNSWAIRWHASLFLNNMYCLHPNMPLLKNIGLDNSGTHCGDKIYEQHPVDEIQVSKITIKEAEWFFEAFRKTQQPPPDKPTTWQQSKKLLKRLFRL
jgi:hypothetical protein